MANLLHSYCWSMASSLRVLDLGTLVTSVREAKCRLRTGAQKLGDLLWLGIYLSRFSMCAKSPKGKMYQKTAEKSWEEKDMWKKEEFQEKKLFFFFLELMKEESKKLKRKNRWEKRKKIKNKDFLDNVFFFAFKY